MDKVGILGNVSTYASNMSRISKAVSDSIRDCDMESAFDCLAKFYAAYNIVSNEIVSYRDVIGEEEVLRIHQTLEGIERDMRKRINDEARKCRIVRG